MQLKSVHNTIIQYTLYNHAGMASLDLTSDLLVYAYQPLGLNHKAIYKPYIHD